MQPTYFHFTLHIQGNIHSSKMPKLCRGELDREEVSQTTNGGVPTFWVTLGWVVDSSLVGTLVALGCYINIPTFLIASLNPLGA